MDTAVLTGVTSLLGTIVGATISYFTSTKLAQYNANLVRQTRQLEARKRVYALLCLTYETIMVIFTDGNRIFHKGQIIFDTEWPKEVPLIDVLSSAEQYLVWLYDIQRLESECESTIGYSYDEFLRIFHAERRDIMLSIINKLKKEP